MPARTSSPSACRLRSVPSMRSRSRTASGRSPNSARRSSASARRGVSPPSRMPRQSVLRSTPSSSAALPRPTSSTRSRSSASNCSSRSWLIRSSISPLDPSPPCAADSNVRLLRGLSPRESRVASAPIRGAMRPIPVERALNTRCSLPRPVGARFPLVWQGFSGLSATLSPTSFLCTPLCHLNRPMPLGQSPGRDCAQCNAVIHPCPWAMPHKGGHARPPL